MQKIILVWLLGAFSLITQAAPIEVQTDALAGRKFAPPPNGLYALWTGISGIVPKKTVVDFHRQLRLAWDIKCQRRKCTDVARQASASVPTRYPAKPTRMTMPDYLRFIDQEVNRAFVDTDWDAVREEYGLTTEEGAMLKKMMRSIGGRELVAYSLTELMPAVRDGDLNVEVLRFLLRYAGREYIELLPAVNDKYTSFGPYQFTSYALFDKGDETRGASRANQALKRRQIGGSVIKLKGPNHHRAAWLFALDNLAKVTRHSSRNELVVLNLLAARPAELVKVVACAHHAPTPCLNAASRWVAGGAKGGFWIAGRNSVYVQKTANNYAALT